MRVSSLGNVNVAGLLVSKSIVDGDLPLTLRNTAPEGLGALESVIKGIRKRSDELYFWSTHSGAEVDLFWQDKGKNFAIEFNRIFRIGQTNKNGLHF